MKIKFICFGTEIDNLKMTFEYNIIGIPKRHQFNKNDIIYLAIKVGNDWFVCGRAQVEQETDLNPFINPGRYYTYMISNVEACEPFSINQISRELLGNYWALIFQTPRYVENDKFIDYLCTEFKGTDHKRTLEILIKKSI